MSSRQFVHRELHQSNGAPLVTVDGYIYCQEEVEVRCLPVIENAKNLKQHQLQEVGGESKYQGEKDLQHYSLSLPGRRDMGKVWGKMAAIYCLTWTTGSLSSWSLYKLLSRNTHPPRKSAVSDAATTKTAHSIASS